MTEILSLHTLCRCCHSDGIFKSLQTPYAYDHHVEVYSAMLKETLNITIHPPPLEASYNICEYCISKLRDAAYFKQQVLDCEQKFEEYCKNEQALTIKEEVHYENSYDDDISSTEENKISSYKADETYDNYDEEKCEVKGIDLKINGENVIQENVDQKYSVKIKQEVIEDTSPKSSAIECNITGKPKAPGPETTLKKDGVKAQKRRRKPTSSEIDPEFESCVKTEDGNVFICKTCDKKYKVLALLRKHIRKEHKDVYKCSICYLQCVGRFHYIQHSKTHGYKRFKCHVCEKGFTQRSSLQQHMNTHTKTDKFQCDICHKYFAYKQTLKKHIMWHYGASKTRMCDICGHGFNDMTNLNNHIRSVHEKQRPFKCHLCPKTFTANKHLKAHSYLHTGEKPYKCLICAENFTSPWKLKNHQNKYHLKTGSSAGQVNKLYTCKVCNLEIDSRGRFMAHVRRHAGQKQYKCHLCTKDFTCKYSLNRHIVGHSGLKPYGCDQCDKKYTQPSLLWRHKRRIHDPNSLLYPGRVVELVKCDLCNKSFKDINKHMVSHKKRPHVCPLCSKCYPERNTLNRHILVVHQGVRRHPCNLCDKKYTKWEGLQKHTRKVHKLELKKEVEES